MQQSATQTVCFSLVIPSTIANHYIRIFLPPTLYLSHLDYIAKARNPKLTHISGPLDDLLTNIQGGLRGGLDFLSIPSGSGAKKAKRAEDIPGAASK